jgi:hypothetical protein
VIDILLVKNLLEERSQAWHRAADLLAFCRAQFGPSLPADVRIFHRHVSAATDVTPDSEADAERLTELDGPFVVVVAPGTGAEFLLAIQIFTVAVTVASIVFAPQQPVATQRNIQTESPNNGLTARENRPRPKARRPDAFGTNWMFPDQLGEPVTRFIEHREVEDSFLGLGRGRYKIAVRSNGRALVREDKTSIDQIAGSSIEIYPPYTSPMHDDPELRIGNAIVQPLETSQRLSSVNGQTLLAADSGGSYRNLARFLSPNVIESDNPDIDYTQMFAAGDSIVITEAVQTEGTVEYQAPEAGLKVIGLNGDGRAVIALDGDLSAEWAAGHIVTIRNAGVRWTVTDGGESESQQYSTIDGTYPIFDVSVTTSILGSVTTMVLSEPGKGNPIWSVLPGGVNSYGAALLSRAGGVVQFDLSGTYIIVTITSTSLTIDDPAAVNLAWNTLADSFGGESRQLRPRMFTAGERWVDAGVLQSVEPVKGFTANLVCLNGLYADNGQQQFPQSVDVVIEATPTDTEGEPLPGAVPELFPGTVVGSGVSRSIRALTIDGTLSAVSNNWRFRARRTSNRNSEFVGQVVDEVKWRDLWGTAPMMQPHFGDMTTVRSRRLATDGALAQKKPKLNIRATRMLPKRIAGSTFTTDLFATDEVADILSAICLDPHIGNRRASDIDFDNFYDTAAQIREYFGFPEASHFAYTFDKTSLSAEQTIKTVAAAVCCTAYRRDKMRLQFERATDDSSVLFNHRNKLPRSDRITDEMGRKKGYDGVEYQYVKASDGLPATIYIPANRSSVNPKKVDGIGVATEAMANIQAWREWMKIQHLHTTQTFDALPEANTLTLTERVLLADNTRSGAQDGEIASVEGLNVRLSQPMAWEPGQSYTIWLQGSNKRVEAIPITPGASPTHGVLARAPAQPLVTDDRMYMKTTYIIASGANARQSRPFLLTEKDKANDDGTIPLTAVNYDERYYLHDRDYATA